MTSEAQLLPIVHKFNAVIDEIENGDMKRAVKSVAKFAKLKLPPNSPPFVKTVNAVLAFKKGDIEQAVVLAREVEAEKPTELSVCNNVLHIFKQTNQTEDLKELYARVRPMRPTEPEIVMWQVTLNLMIRDYAKAQEAAMLLMKMEPKPVIIVLAACCAYMRAMNEKNAMFFKFTLAFLDKAKDIVTPELLQMRFNAMFELGQVKEALELLEKPDVREKLKYDMLGLLRNEMKVYEKLEDWEKVAATAEKILREVNEDSLDEWKVVVKHHAKAAELIDEISAKNAKLRGPQLAKIELALKNGQDVSALVHAYIEKYSGRGHLLGDVKPYLTPEVLAKLPDVTDVSINCLKKKAFCGEVTDPRTASMKAQELMMAGKFKEAADVCAKYGEEPDARCMLIRLAGLMNCSVAQHELWTKQKLEAIQFLSLANWWLLDAMRCWDITTIDKMLESTSKFVFKGQSAFNGHVTAALNNYNVFTAQMCIDFRHEVLNHVMTYMTDLVSMWVKFLQGKEEPTQFKLEKVRAAQDLPALINRCDQSAIPLYFESDELKAQMYPDMIKTVHSFSAAMKVLLLLKLRPADVSAAVTEGTSVVAGTSWESFFTFVNGGCKTFASADTTDIFVLGSIALAAKFSGTLAPIREPLMAAVTAAAAKVEQTIPSDLPEIFASKLEEQKARIRETVALVSDLH